MYDMPKTEGLMFQFVDDIANVYQDKELKDGKVILIKDLELLNKYLFPQFVLKVKPYEIRNMCIPP